MDTSQYGDLAQQLSMSVGGATKAIKGISINEKVKSVKDFFQDQSQVLLGKQLEESLGAVKKAGGLLKSLGLKSGDIEKIAKQTGSKAKAVGKKFAEDAKAKIKQQLENTKDDVAKSTRQKIRGEDGSSGETGDIPLQNMASGDVGSGEEANPISQDGEIVQNAEREAQTTEQSIARGGGSVLGEDKPIAGSAKASSQEQQAMKDSAEKSSEPDTTEQQKGAKEQNENNSDKEKDEDGDAEGKAERDLKDATKGTEEEDAVDPLAEEASLPLTAILGATSLIVSMFTKDHHQKVIQRASPAQSYSVQVGL